MTTTLDTSIINAEGRFDAWPTVTRCADGALVLTYSGGREKHICPFGQVQMMRSIDHGSTWSAPRVLRDGLLDDRDPAVMQTPTGALIVTWFTSTTWLYGEDPLPEHWRSRSDIITTEVIDRELGAWAIRSEDGGETWSNPIDTKVNSPHGPISESEGRLIYVGRQSVDQGQRGDYGSPLLDRLCVAESTDDGGSWQWRSELPTRIGDDPRHYHEPHVIADGCGGLVALVRNHNPINDKELLRSRSRDGGLSWTQLEPTGIWGYPPHLLRLSDGRVLLSYGYRRSPLGIAVRVSDDDGWSWSNPHWIVRDAPHEDLGYPSSVELSPGHFLTMWYERRGNDAKLRQALWNWDALPNKNLVEATI